MYAVWYDRYKHGMVRGSLVFGLFHEVSVALWLLPTVVVTYCFATLIWQRLRGEFAMPVFGSFFGAATLVVTSALSFGLVFGLGWGLTWAVSRAAALL
jgi:hypothetical protein